MASDEANQSNEDEILELRISGDDERWRILNSAPMAPLITAYDLTTGDRTKLACRGSLVLVMFVLGHLLLYQGGALQRMLTTFAGFVPLLLGMTSFETKRRQFSFLICFMAFLWLYDKDGSLWSIIFQNMIIFNPMMLLVFASWCKAFESRQLKEIVDPLALFMDMAGYVFLTVILFLANLWFVDVLLQCGFLHVSVYKWSSLAQGFVTSALVQRMATVARQEMDETTTTVSRANLRSSLTYVALFPPSDSDEDEEELDNDNEDVETGASSAVSGSQTPSPSAEKIDDKLHCFIAIFTALFVVNSTMTLFVYILGKWVGALLWIILQSLIEMTVIKRQQRLPYESERRLLQEEELMVREAIQACYRMISFKNCCKSSKSTVSGGLPTKEGVKDYDDPTDDTESADELDSISGD